MQEYYILDDQDRYTVFYERTATGTYQPLPAQPGGVIASGILPGFQFRLEDLYRQPTWQEMVEAPVYQGFVLPAYVAERQRADQAEAVQQDLTHKLQEAEVKLKQAGLL